MSAATELPLVLGSHRLSSRLIVGTGKYATFELMQECLAISGSDVITVAVRRERLMDANGRNILDFIDLDRYTILPNTAGCFTADEAVRTARLGREILSSVREGLFLMTADHRLGSQVSASGSRSAFGWRSTDSGTTARSLHAIAVQAIPPRAMASICRATRSRRWCA